MSDCQPNACPTECYDWIFQRVVTLPRIRGGTRVEWYLSDQFQDPLPWSFQLQVGSTGSNVASDWSNVGPPAINTWYLLDDEDRVYGLQQWTHYRIQLTTSSGVYYSNPAPCLGTWGFRKWRLAQGILRAETVNFKAGEGKDGYVLKRKISGIPCPCLDTLTAEVRRAQHELCYGTGWLGGYYEPVGCCYALMLRSGIKPGIEPEGPRGQSADVIVQARMLAIPQLGENDVWVDKDTDHRYIVRGISTEKGCEVQGVPVVYEPITLHLLPFSDIVYNFPIPYEVPAW